MSKLLVVYVADENRSRYEFPEATSFTFGRPRPGWIMFIEPDGATTLLQEQYVVSIGGMDKVRLDL